MNKGKTIFSQIMSLIPERNFKTCVDRYKGNYRARNFSCKDQFLVMSYAQLTGRDSLRDIENCLTALSSKLYHCGISYAVPRNTLAKANEKRDWHIYKDFADVLLKKVRPLYAKDSISPIQRPHYIPSSYTYQFFEKSYSCIVFRVKDC